MRRRIDAGLGGGGGEMARGGWIIGLRGGGRVGGEEGGVKSEVMFFCGGRWW